MRDDPHVPLTEEDILSSIRVKVNHGERLTKKEDNFLHALANRAKE